VNGSLVDIYDGQPGAAGSHRVGRITIPPLDPGAYVELTGTLNLAGLPAATTGLQSIYLLLDPENKVEELNENNNLVLAGGVLGGPFNTPPPPEGHRVYLPLVRR
jgi:hypothetical protein